MGDSKKTTRVLIVDDHPFVRKGIRGVLEQQEGFSVCAEAGNRAEAIDCCGKQVPHVALIDLSLGDESGLDLIKDLRGRFPDIKILVLSMRDEMLYAERVLRAGASGYIGKDADPAELVAAVNDIQGGGIYASPAVQQKIMKSVCETGSTVGTDPIALLSDRELAVFEQIGRGRKTAEIAESMCLSIKTVETYRARIKAKLGIESSSQLIQQAVQWGAGSTS